MLKEQDFFFLSRISYFKMSQRDFPDSPVVKNPPRKGRGHGSNPWSEN